MLSTGHAYGYAVAVVCVWEEGGSFERGCLVLLLIMVIRVERLSTFEFVGKWEIMSVKRYWYEKR